MSILSNIQIKIHGLWSEFQADLYKFTYYWTPILSPIEIWNLKKDIDLSMNWFAPFPMGWRLWASHTGLFLCVSFFNVNFGNELIRTVSNGMKAVCKPYWAVWQESDQPCDANGNLGIRDRPEIWWDMIRYDKIWWDMLRYDEIWWLHDEIWLIGEIWWVTSQVMGIVVLIGDGWAD